jgi:hypothetical protein
MKMAQVQRTYIPAAGHDWLLSFYDPFVKLMGGESAHRQLIDQTRLQPGQRILEIGCGTDPSAEIAFSGMCCFCGDRIGAAHGRYSDAPVRASVVHGASAMCGECLQLMRDIVEEKTRDDKAVY